MVNLGIDNALPVTTVLTMDGGDGTGSGSGRQTVLNLNGHDQTVAGLTNVPRNLRTQSVRNTSGTYATLTVNNNVNYTFSGLLGSGGTNFGLTKDGSRTLTLSGANTYTGGTTVNGGTLTSNREAVTGLDAAGPFGANNAGNVVTVNNGGVLNGIIQESPGAGLKPRWTPIVASPGVSWPPCIMIRSALSSPVPTMSTWKNAPDSKARLPSTSSWPGLVPGDRMPKNRVFPGDFS